MRILQLIFCTLFFSACPLLADDTQPGVWSTDVIEINESLLEAEHWVNQTSEVDQLLKTQEEIAAFNRDIVSTNTHMVDLGTFPQNMPGMEVRKRIQAISKPNSSDLYKPEGGILTSSDYRQYTKNLDLDHIPDTIKLQFALVVRRSDMRTYPSNDRHYKSPDDQNLDRFQENTLFPADMVTVLHFSADGEWAFVQSYNYTAWVKRDDIAIGDHQLIQRYKTAQQFLVITGAKVHTNFNPDVPALSELQLDMGIRLPLADRESYGNELYGQNPYASYVVLLPTRNPDGQLEIKPALVARSNDVRKGYLPFTRENIIRQAFKFLGERYGWGHSYNARDCTGFIMEIYKTFGFLMPRNTGQQGAGSYGENTRFMPTSTPDEKMAALQKMDVGDLLYVPGHVLMYIGDVDGKPYVIHDVSVFRYIDEHGDYYEGTLNGVSVTPLIPLYGSRESPYIDLVYNIKRVR